MPEQWSPPPGVRPLNDAEIRELIQPLTDADYRAMMVDEAEEAATPPVARVVGCLVHRPAVRQRNAIRYLTVRSWRARAKFADMQLVKRSKRDMDVELIELAAGEVAELIASTIGPLDGFCASCVACGHSRRPDCFGKRLAQAAATRLGVGFVQAFQDRFVAGVSHPLEFRKLPELTWATRPTAPVILVDDIATSGWHLEEAATRLRELGRPVVSIAWLGGEVA